MTDQKQDILFAARTSQTLAFTLARADGSVFDITGAAGVKFRASPFPSGEAVVQKDLAGGIGIINAALGQITVAIANDDLEDAGLYVFDIVVTQAAVDTRGKYGRIVVGVGVAPPEA